MVEEERHPLPLVLMHWIHLLSMGLLGLSGLYIHYVLWPGWMGNMRQIHFISMYVLIFTLTARVYWAIFGGPRDIKNFWFQKENRGQFIEILKYYAFIRKTHPKTAKFNPVQKITYDFWGLLLILQALTGFSLYWPQVSFFSTLNTWVGGLGPMRMIHFLIMWILIVTVAVHVYMTLAEDLAQFPSMIFGVKKEQ
jgi:Ni/Fe-hydrogenase 1 B-type cytochrome subunit